MNESAESAATNFDYAGAQNAYRTPEQLSMERKLADAIKWLGNRYLMAHPVKRRRPSTYGLV